MPTVIGVFGGSGFYDFLDAARTEEVSTPYGEPAAAYRIGTISGTDVAFLPRHGDDHRFPAHRVPYRANVWGMRELGVKRIISPSAVGSLQLDIAPGSFVVTDQLVDRTWGRDHTYFDGPETVHVSMADPFCPELRSVALEALRSTGAAVHDGGTMVVIQGPRFSSRAESAGYQREGFATINMSQAPEAGLARELEMCFANIAVVTDHDTGVDGSEPVSHAQVVEQFGRSIGTLKEAIAAMVGPASATPRDCGCKSARTDAS